MNKYAHLKPQSDDEKRKAIRRRFAGAAKMCFRKRPFDSEDHAKQRAAELTKQGVPMRHYQCPHCYRWHLASNA